MSDRTCKISGCDRTGRLTRGMCDAHYARWHRTGDPGDPLPEYTRYKSQEDRFWAKVAKRGHDECWPWLGGKSPNGYGTVRRGGKTTTAHRYAYQLAIGPVRDDLEIDHVWARGCTRRDCCNPAHLEAVTQQENNLRSNSRSALSARQTHCKYGHEFTDANTYVNRHGDRSCRECHKINERERRKRAA